jgi:hypothetical protein
MLAREKGITGLRGAAFLLGNIEPDLLFVSYLCGQERHPFAGHLYPEASQRMLRLCLQLDGGCRTIADHFRLGKLCHYTADCFTWPHDPSYPGTMAAHISYERQLNRCFRREGRPGRAADAGLSPPERFRQAHERFIEETPCVRRDIRYITAVTGGIVDTLAVEEKPLLRMRLAAAVVLPE